MFGCGRDLLLKDILAIIQLNNTLLPTEREYNVRISEIIDDFRIL